MIPYERQIEYLSPSSLSQFEEDPLAFYFQRLGPIEYRPERDPQTYPMAVGSAFDALVKWRIAQRNGLDCPTPKEMIRENVVTPDRREEAILFGRGLADFYEECGALDDLADTTSVEVLCDVATVPGTGKFGVPIKGEIDAVRGAVVHDWKVTGAGSSYARSPNPGYVGLWDSRCPAIKFKAHPRAWEPFEHLNAKWATQCVMYHWMLGRGIDAPLAVSIDQVVCAPDGRVRVAQYRGDVSVEFQLAVKDRLSGAWQAISQQSVVASDLAAVGVETLRRL